MELTTHVEIDASPDRVWDVLTDFDRYHEWNPFLAVAGRATEGARLHVALSPPGAPTTRFRPTVTRVDPSRELRWLGHLWTTGLFDGEHRFVLTPLDGDTRTSVTHAESMSGVLLPIVWRFVGDATERGFEAMNLALKRRVESTDNGARGDTRPHPRPTR
ncbi:SRPBCC domain-containing protein [Salinigranum salinum]|uniref:SRPBCC domain-containing protein n=1 Tax=Salinigranum salinum TaxID=1364937 RepID=UPI001260A786|nr:SRPBCC domain-containing protein [Salinigranum salinum]